MAKKTVSTNDLAPGTSILIRGQVSYSRITSFVDGEELRKDQERRQAKGWSPITRPYTSITICNAQILAKDPNNLSKADIYIQEHLYQSASPNCPGWVYTAVNTGTILPWIARMQPDGKHIQQIPLEGELATGLDVTLVLNVFKSKAGMNNGLGLNGIILNEDVRYYNGAGTAGLAERGLIFTPCAAAAPAPEPAANAPVFTPEEAQSPFMNPATAQAPDVAPAPASPFTSMPAPNPAPAPAPAPASPFATQQPTAGIQYNPTDRNYQ